MGADGGSDPTRHATFEGAGASASERSAGGTAPSARQRGSGASTGQSDDLSLELELGQDRVLAGWEELDDYHDIPKDVLASVDVRQAITGGDGATLLCQTAALKRSTVRAADVTDVYCADDPEAEVHTYRTEVLDGDHVLFGLVVDVFEERTATDRIEFTVR